MVVAEMAEAEGMEGTGEGEAVVVMAAVGSATVSRVAVTEAEVKAVAEANTCHSRHNPCPLDRKHRGRFAFHCIIHSSSTRNHSCKKVDPVPTVDMVRRVEAMGTAAALEA